MTTLILVRHGQSQTNLEQIFAGHMDISLTELGHRQAENTARFLAEYPIQAIYSSDLLRAMQTATPTAKQHGLEIVPRQELREIYAGDWEGVPYEELKLRYPDSYGRWCTDCGNATPDGGESVKALAERIYAEVDRIRLAHLGQCVAIFTHATPIRTLRARWEGYSVAEMSNLPFCGNASVSVLEYGEDGSCHVRLCCYDGHQGELATHLAKGVV